MMEFAGSMVSATPLLAMLILRRNFEVGPLSLRGRGRPRHTDLRLNPWPSLWHHLSMPKVHIPTPLRQYAGKQPAVEVKGSTIGEALNGLVAKHPDLRRNLYTTDGNLRALVTVNITV